jgi:type I restriction enzyme S subunit
MIETRFKDTEIGKIPEEWEVKQIKGFADVHSGKGVIRISKGCNGFPVIGGNGKIGNYSDAFNTRDSIAIGRVGALCGNVHRIKEKSWITDNALILEAIGSYKVDLDFLYFLLKTKNLNSLCVGNAQPLITGGTVLSLQMPLPPLPEQRRIADALSKVDSLIASLDKLIAKKQAIKRGAMQELLTGKKRLPGFQGEWKKDKIESFGEINGGGTPNTNIKAFWTGQFPWISSSDINEDDISNISVSRFITKKAIANSSTILCPSNTIHLVSRVGLGKVAYTQERVCTSQDFCNLTINKENDIIFLSYLLLTKMKSVAKEGQGTTIKGISIEQIKNFVLNVPPLPEQRAIAHVLSSMDAEIEALERKRDKFRQVKQGMMQDLLTGRIRLTDN